MINTPLLAEICKIPGAPGFEKLIRDFVLKTIEGLVDEVKVDNMGNILALKKGKSNDKCSMAAAHIDEIGFIVKYIDDKGFIYFHTLGGFDPKTLTSQRVIIHGKEDIIGVMGTKPIHLMSADERGKQLKIEDYFIDTGMTGDTVKSIVNIGDPITRERSLIEMGDCVNSKSLDNRVSVFILIEALKLLKGKEIPFDFHAVFSVQEEVGLRGAQTAAQQINPHWGWGIDTTIAFDVPGAQAHEKVTSLGEGVAIKIMDTSAICDYRMTKFMKTIADENNIKWQPEVLTGGGTDTASIQKHGTTGAIAGAISIPTRHIHQTIEMCHKSDIKGAIDLLVSCVLSINNYNWEH